MISQTEAIAITLQQVFDWGTESIPLEQSFSRVLAEDIIADRPQPPFNRVTMDGICIDYTAYAKGQRFFPIARLQAAGDVPLPLTDPTQCIEIMTGAALPSGVSTVIRYEDLKAENNGFLLPDGLTDNKNIHTVGSDLQLDGKAIIQKGNLIGAAEIGMLATFGYDFVEVRKKPTIAVISTGDELVEVATKTPASHQIRRSNVHQLAALIRAKGIEVTTHHLPDERNAMTANIATSLVKKDILIFSGGVSKGKLDYLPEVLANLGVEKLFHGVAQRPGKPLWTGRTASTMVFGLPGNPVSSLACLLLYVGPFIRQSLGLPKREHSYYPLAIDHRFKPDLSLALTATLAQTDNNQEVTAHPVIGQGSGDATSLLRTDGFLLLPCGRELFSAGDRFPFLPINELY